MTLPTTERLRQAATEALHTCGVDPAVIRPAGVVGPDGVVGSAGTNPAAAGGERVVARSPITGESLFGVTASPAEGVTAGAAAGPGVPDQAVALAVSAAGAAYEVWRTTPAPVRGALVKRLGELIAEHRGALADLITIEAGKIRSEALGEVQEMIDICDFAVGLSRQLYGRTMPSERPGHRLMETWHPLGVVGVISAFNFPLAVWSWNVAVALVCGDAVVWKPSELTPLTALAASALLDRAIAETGAPAGVHRLVLGGAGTGAQLVDSPSVALLSATGSTAMGRIVAGRVAARFGRSLLELGGNNAVVVAPSADLDLATRAIVFAAAGTAGQRCTTTRRVIVHDRVADDLLGRLVDAYGRLPIGDPFDPASLVGPLITEAAFNAMQDALSRAGSDGGKLFAGGGRRLADAAPAAYYVEPAIVAMPAQTDIVRAETFAPLLFVLGYREFDEAVALHNGVPQGLSSGIFTRDQAEAEHFLAADGADCGIVNVNIATSGAEIGGAFGGEKDTGGGRESGSDAWRAYMRRATNTINYSGAMVLAQDVTFL